MGDFNENPQVKTPRTWWQVAGEVILWLLAAAVLLLLPNLLGTSNKIAVILCYAAAFAVAVFGAFRPRALRRSTPLWKHIAFCALFWVMLLVFVLLVVAASFFLIRFL